MTEVTAALVLGSGSFVAVVLLTPLARRVALAYDITDHPASHKVHHKTTPYLGGVALVLTSLGASAFLSGWRLEASVLILGASLVGVVGLVDDVHSLQPRPRLIVETVAALLAAGAGARVEILGGPADWVITVVWLVVMTNSFNLLDNMDGAAGVIATTTALALAVAAGLGGQWLVGSLAAVVAGSSAGFLVYNWHPARIFMGDAGSLFLGFLLSAIALKLRFPVSQSASAVSLGFLMGPALFDTTLVVISRLRAGTRLFQGGTDHTAHRLLRLGLSTRGVTVVLAMASLTSCAVGVAVARDLVPAEVVLAPALLLAAGCLMALLRVPSQDGTSLTTHGARLGTADAR